MNILAIILLSLAQAEHDPVVLDLATMEATRATVVIGEKAWHTFTVPIRRFSTDRVEPLPVPQPVPKPPPTPVQPETLPDLAIEGEAWAYYVIDAQRSTPGQAAIATDPSVRAAIDKQQFSFRLIRSNQNEVKTLNLQPWIVSEGMPVLLIADSTGRVVSAVRSPMASDIVAVLEQARGE